MKLKKSSLESYIAAGMRNRFWYEESMSSAMRWCTQHNQDLTQLLSVAAILSPRVQVARSIRLAKQWVLTRSESGIMKQRVNALEIYHTSGKVSGTKINAFRDSLMLVRGAVCIDIHMSRIFGFDKGELMEETKKYKILRGKSQRIVKKLAKKYGVESYQMQAILWCGYLTETQGYDSARCGAMNFEEASPDIGV